MLDRCLTDDDLARLLREDVPYGDLTTRALSIGDRPGRLVFQSRRPMVVCGIEEAARLLQLAGGTVETAARSGDRVGGEAVLLRATGPAAGLHLAWKTAQNLVDHASGIATAAAAIVTAAREADPEAVVACTRKNVPGAKAIAVKAVLAGGAEMHRLGLSETLLVFPEHRAFLPSDMSAWLPGLKRRCPEKTLVVEVTDAPAALAAASAGADVLQLERFSPPAVAELVASLDARGLKVTLAVAGGVTADTAAAFVRAGARVVVTSAPYTAPPQDIRVTLSPIA